MANSLYLLQPVPSLTHGSRSLSPRRLPCPYSPTDSHSPCESQCTTPLNSRHVCFDIREASIDRGRGGEEEGDGEETRGGEGEGKGGRGRGRRLERGLADRRGGGEEGVAGDGREGYGRGGEEYRKDRGGSLPDGGRRGGLRHCAVGRSISLDGYEERLKERKAGGKREKHRAQHRDNNILTLFRHFLQTC